MKWHTKSKPTFVQTKKQPHQSIFKKVSFLGNNLIKAQLLEASHLTIPLGSAHKKHLLDFQVGLVEAPFMDCGYYCSQD